MDSKTGGVSAHFLGKYLEGQGDLVSRLTN